MSLRKKITILFPVIIGAIGLIAYFIILPTVNDIKKISRSIYAERVDLEKKYIKGQLLKKTLEDFEKIKPHQERLETIFLFFGKELEFITTLEKIANDNSVNQEIILEINKGKKKDSLTQIPIDLTIEGSFANTIRYLNDLEKLRYYITLDSLKISLIGVNKGDVDSIKTNLSGLVYAAGPQEEKQK